MISKFENLEKLPQKYDSTVIVLHNRGLRQMCTITAKLFAATSAVKRPLLSRRCKTANPKLNLFLSSVKRGSFIIYPSRKGKSFPGGSPAVDAWKEKKQGKRGGKN